MPRCRVLAATTDKSLKAGNQETGTDNGKAAVNTDKVMGS